MINKTTRKDKSKKSKKTNRKVNNQLNIIKKACKNFGKPIYLMRHLHTDSNIWDSTGIKKFKPFKKKKGGGGIGNVIPYVPLFNREPTISYWGRKSVKMVPSRYNISKTKDKRYVIIVSPLMRTWTSALLFIRSLMKDQPFKLTLIISPITEKPSSGYGNKSMINSYSRFFKEEVKKNEHIELKFCDNIDDKNDFVDYQ